MTRGMELRDMTRNDDAVSRKLSGLSFGSGGEHLFSLSPAVDVVGHGAFLGGRLIGQAFDLHESQWWGGKKVVAAGVAHVSVSAEARGQGVARALISRLLETAKERGAMVSVLFPSLATVYARLGWASVGSVDTLSIPTLALPRSGPAGLSVHQGTSSDLDMAREVYRRVAVSSNGLLSRDQPRHFRSLGGAEGVTVVLDSAGPVAYARWSRGRKDERGGTLTVEDVLALNPEAARAVLAVLSGWHTVVPELRMRLHGRDAVSGALSTDQATSRFSRSWMHRPVDVVGAVSERGWPTGISGWCSFALADDLASWNSGTWELKVSDGAGELRRCDDASVSLSVSGFGALYCGVATPAELVAQGRVSGPAGEVAALGLLGCGAPARMLDTF